MVDTGPPRWQHINTGLFMHNEVSEVFYTAIQALEGHINCFCIAKLQISVGPNVTYNSSSQGVGWLRKLDPVDFSHERMICCYTNLLKVHFLVDTVL